MSGNPLDGFVVRERDVKFIGQDLQRPECILAEPDGTLWSADARGGVVRIAPDGTQTVITQQVDRRFTITADAARRFTEGTLPNGLAFAANGDILIANFGTDCLEIMSRDGRTRTLHDTIDGRPMGKANFVLRDSRGRLWLTVSTRVKNWMEAVKHPDLADGYVALVDERGIRIVADGFKFTNEAKLDAREEFLYIVETTGRRISRMRVAGDGSLSAREIFGPSDLGGFPDGFAFDAYGNLWITLIMREHLVALTPDGELRSLWDLGDPAAVATLDRNFFAGTLAPEHMFAAKSTLAPWMASVTFGSPDLRTVYIGTLAGNTIPYFRSPVSGLPLVHWAR